MNTPDRPLDEQPIGDNPTSDERLSAYLDDELSAADRAALDAQLAQNPELRETLAELGMLSQMLQALPKQSLPSQFSERVLRRAERQMLLGEPAEHEQDLPSVGTPCEISTGKSHHVRWTWWIPAALAALLAGVLLVPPFLKRFDVAQVNPLPEPAEKGMAVDEVASATEGTATEAKLTEAHETAAAERYDGPARGGRRAEALVERLPRSRVVEPTDTSDREEMRAGQFAAEADEVSPGADDVALKRPRPTAGDAADWGDVNETRRTKGDDRAERAKMHFGAAAVESRGQPLATSDWQYDQDSPLLEVQLPAVVAGKPSFRARQPSRGAGRAAASPEGVTAPAGRSADDAGQLYGIQGSPDQLGRLIGEFQRQGAIVQDHELPPQLKIQLAKQQADGWIDRSVDARSESRYASDVKDRLGDLAGARLELEVDENRAGEPMQWLLDNSELEITVLEPTDSDALARIAEQHVRRDGRQQPAPSWLRKMLRDTEHESPAMQAPAEAEASGELGRAALSEEVNPRANGQIPRALDATADGPEAAPQRVQLYLWLRSQAQAEVERESDGPEKPSGTSDGN